MFMKHTKILLLLCLFILTVIAWYHRFIMDDAFISLRYSKNMYEGYGLIWNPGDRVPSEGYTNFLWIIITTIPFFLKIDPIIFSELLGVFFFSLSLYFTFKLSLLIFQEKIYAFLALILTGLNFSFSSFATSGLETSLRTFLLLFCFYFTFSILRELRWNPKKTILLSLAMAAALLTRLDSGIFILVLWTAILIELCKKKEDAKEKWKTLISLFLPFILVVVTWFIWKEFYYSQLLPNTYYAKVNSFTFFTFIRGFIYVFVFFVIYGFFIFVPIFILRFKSLVFRQKEITILVAFILLWLLYVIRIGGDIFEFRFLVDLIPFIYIVILFIVSSFRLNYQIISVSFLLFCLLIYHFEAARYYRVLTSIGLSGFTGVDRLKEYVEVWSKIGKKFHDYFSQIKEPPNIAVTAAGAIPYFSELNSIDMLGLNTPEILLTGHKRQLCLVCAGHQKIASISNLLSMKANLVIGNPVIMTKKERDNFKISDLKKIFFDEQMDFNNIPTTSKIVFIPIDNEDYLLVLYLQSNSEVDRLINLHDWKTIPLDQTL